jgi:uncharacterized protein DUF3455
MSSKLGSVVSGLIAALLAGTPASAVSADPNYAASASGCSGTTPSTLAVPAGNTLAFELRAEGVQIYSCAAAPGAAGPAWAFQAPQATLVDDRGQPAGDHHGGPTWDALDGSSVVGAKLEAATPDPAAIPWLLLRAASHAGRGRMADVTFVQRIQTTGGLAPSQGCDAAAIGTVVRVPYRAAYCFYRGAGATATAPSQGSPSR